MTDDAWIQTYEATMADTLARDAVIVALVARYDRLRDVARSMRALLRRVHADGINGGVVFEDVLLAADEVIGED